LKPDDYPNNSAHHGMAMSVDGSKLCAAGTIDDYVAIISRPALTTDHIVNLGKLPSWTVTSTDGKSPKRCSLIRWMPSRAAAPALSHVGNREGKRSAPERAPSSIDVRTPTGGRSQAIPRWRPYQVKASTWQ
jgi:hypothetical protein